MRIEKTLYLDTEGSYKTLGNKEMIADLFGYPMLEVSSLPDVSKMLKNFFPSKTVSREVTIGDVKVTIKQKIYGKRKNTPIDAIVIDTVSELLLKRQREIKKPMAVKTTLGQWGQLKVEMDHLLEFLHAIPTSVVLTTHQKQVKVDDDEEEVLKYIPGILGSSKDDIGKWFDFVLYTKTDKKKGAKNTKYLWVSQRSNKYCHAKDRSKLLDPVLAQNFQLLIDAATERGWKYIKVLIVGDPGSGKTESLKTLPFMPF